MKKAAGYSRSYLIKTYNPGAVASILTHAAISFCGAVELDDVHFEPIRDLIPDLRPQPVAEQRLHSVPLLPVVGRGAVQIAGNLPYVLGALHYIRVFT